VEELGIGRTTVYRWEANLMRYGSAVAPCDITALGAPHKLRKDDEDALFATLASEGWIYQLEMQHWLYMERGILVSQPTISRLLRRKGWT
jgi:transposase